MAEIATLIAETRPAGGTGAARAVRRAGKVPAIVYGSDGDPTPVALNRRDLTLEWHRPGFFSRLYDLKVGDKTFRVLPREVQSHPVTEAPLHADFLRLRPDSIVRVHVPVAFLNDHAAPGLKRDGVLNVVRHTVELVCRADSIPEALRVDLTDLDIGDSVHISAVILPAGIRPVIVERDFTIATIAAPTIYDEVTAEAEVAAAAAAAAAAVPGVEGAAPEAAPETAEKERKTPEKK